MSGITSFKKWEINSIPNIGYDVDKITWGAEGFVVTIVPDGPERVSFQKNLQLVWDPSQIISYHVTDETYRSDCWGLDFQKEGRFFALKESEYISDMQNKSPLFPDGVIHFVIIGTNTILDLLAKGYPKTILIDK